MRNSARAAFVALIGVVSLGFVPAAGAATVAPEVAKQYMTDLGNRAMDTIAKQPDAAQRNAQFVALMLDHLDFDSIGAFAIGKLNRAATPEERRAYKPLFAAYVIDVAVAKFGDLPLKSFGLGSVQPQPNGDAKVFTRLNTGGTPMEVYWRVHQADGKTSINDIEVAGYSLAMHYRGDFERAGVGTMSGVIDRLRDLTKGSKSLPQIQQAMR